MQDNDDFELPCSFSLLGNNSYLEKTVICGALQASASMPCFTAIEHDNIRLCSLLQGCAIFGVPQDSSFVPSPQHEVYVIAWG